MVIKFFSEVIILKMILITIFIVFIWFLIGFFSAFFLWCYDMRGKYFDKDYFNDIKTIYLLINCLALGVLAPFVILCDFISKWWKTREHKYYFKHIFTKFIYKIANIGVKKKEEKDGATAD